MLTEVATPTGGPALGLDGAEQDLAFEKAVGTACGSGIKEQQGRDLYP